QARGRAQLRGDGRGDGSRCSGIEDASLACVRTTARPAQGHEMTSDEIQPGEVLSDAIEVLRAPRPLVPGLLDRAGKRQVALKRRNRFMAGAPLLTAMLVALGLA